MNNLTDSTGQRKEMILEIPLRILQDRQVAVLEAIVEYLREEKGLTFHRIAVLLNRDDRTIWTAYSRVRKKRNKK